MGLDGHVSTMKDEITKIYGKAGMRKPPSRDELYGAVDVILEAVRSHKARLDVLEGNKPRVRVPAGSEHV